LCTAALAAACVFAPHAGSAGFYTTPYERTPTPAELAELGRAMFFDAGLSANGKMSCATCHDPRHAYGPPGAPTPGALRAAPSLRYLQSVPPFTEHMHEADGDDSADQGPAGGRTWDGRAQSAHDQARLPLLSPTEMGNASAQSVLEKLRKASYAGKMRAAFGAAVLDDSATAFNALLWSLEVFQQQPADFYPYDSKYDAYLRGQAELTKPEARGLAAFNDPERGNCASCHPSGMKNGAHPAFTDYGYIALGVPRNGRLSANADATFYDLGLCGPLRKDLSDRSEYCGLFRTPTLRNAAVRTTYFHNARFRTLGEVVDFYAERDIAPRRWYGRDCASGSHFDDLPAAYAGNVNRDPPFDRDCGQAPRLTKLEREDIIAFLRTLTDGYRSPAAQAAKK
jgi:cytochrome c peroxidase